MGLPEGEGKKKKTANDFEAKKKKLLLFNFQFEEAAKQREQRFVFLVPLHTISGERGRKKVVFKRRENDCSAKKGIILTRLCFERAAMGKNTNIFCKKKFLSALNPKLWTSNI